METESTFSRNEIDFLKILKEGAWTLKNQKASLGIQSLINRGYCRTYKEKIGPLGVWTGEYCICLTEAGKIILQNEE